MDNQSKQYWDMIYDSREKNEVSWFQPFPKTSIESLELFNLPLDSNVIDIVGGDSYFVIYHPG